MIYFWRKSVGKKRYMYMHAAYKYTQSSHTHIFSLTSCTFFVRFYSVSHPNELFSDCDGACIFDSIKLNGKSWAKKKDTRKWKHTPASAIAISAHSSAHTIQSLRTHILSSQGKPLTAHPNYIKNIIPNRIIEMGKKWFAEKGQTFLIGHKVDAGRTGNIEKKKKEERRVRLSPFPFSRSQNARCANKLFETRYCALLLCN